LLHTFSGYCFSISKHSSAFSGFSSGGMADFADFFPFAGFPSLLTVLFALLFFGGLAGDLRTSDSVSV